MELAECFNEVYKGKKVLITGNTGFKGSWITLWLLQLGAEITGVSKEIPTQPSVFEDLELEKQIDHHFLDINDYKPLEDLVTSTNPDFIFHLAAQPIVSESYKDPLSTLKTNAIGTANLLEAVRLIKKKCAAILITSDKCYDNVEWEWGYRENDRLGGKDPYSASKACAEIVFNTYFHSFFKESSNVTLATVRAGNVIGGGDWAQNRIVPDCYRAWYNEDMVEIRNPNATRPWQHVLEPLGGYLTLGAHLYAGKNITGSSYNFGPKSENNHSVKSLILGLLNEQDIFSKKVSEGNAILFHEAKLLKLNCDKALADLNWTPVLGFEQTLKLTKEWYEFYGKKYTTQELLSFTKNQIAEYINLAISQQKAWLKI